jgi:hypothetical protein
MNSENLDSFVISDPTDIEGTLSPSIQKNYNLSLRKKIAERVESLKSKKHFKHIFKLIHNSCPNSYTRDGTGVYINFEVIPNDAMEQVEKYLNEVSPKTSLIPLPAKYTPYFSDEFNPKDSGIKLSNHEKNFLKYIGNDSESKNNIEQATYLDTESSMRGTSETNTVKTKIIIKPFTFE